jgi:hypothetical protein
MECQAAMILSRTCNGTDLDIGADDGMRAEDDMVEFVEGKGWYEHVQAARPSED